MGSSYNSVTRAIRQSRLGSANHMGIRTGLVVAISIMSVAVMGGGATAADDPRGICHRADIKKKYAGAIKKHRPEVVEALSQHSLGSFGGQWQIDDIVLRGTVGEGTVCQATLTLDYLKRDRSFANLHYPETLFLVERASRNGWTVRFYQPPSQNKNAGEWRNADGLTAADIAHNRRVDEDLRQLQAFGRKIGADDAEETRKRKVPCEQSGGTWGYYEGKLGCYFRTIAR